MASVRFTLVAATIRTSVFCTLDEPTLMIFTTFKHTQQTCLSSKRQLSYFIQKDGSTIGFGKITVTVADSARKSTLFMSEQARNLWYLPE